MVSKSAENSHHSGPADDSQVVRPRQGYPISRILRQGLSDKRDTCTSDHVHPRNYRCSIAVQHILHSGFVNLGLTEPHRVGHVLHADDTVYTFLPDPGRAATGFPL